MIVLCVPLTTLGLLGKLLGRPSGDPALRLSGVVIIQPVLDDVMRIRQPEEPRPVQVFVAGAR